MAPVATATAVPVPNHNPAATKIKRPPPPGIQTNGASSSRTSPSQSPSMSVKRTPTGGNKAQPTSISAAVNGVNRAAPNRPRREPSTQTTGRSGRVNGLRSASQALDSAVPQSFEPRPEVITDQYILKKHAGSPPSLIVHLYPTHFRFDQQDGIFQYKSPMRVFLDHLRSKTIPHDLLSYFIDAGVVFYDGCLIVEVHDHKTPAQSKDVARPSSASNKTTPNSVHNYAPWVTPSPYVPYPKENIEAAPNTTEETKPAESNSNDKENMPAPGLPNAPKSKPPLKPKIITRVLHPTPQSLQVDLIIKASTPRGSNDSNVPPTPMSAVPPTPSAASMPPPAKKQKKERMELDSKNLHVAEGQILLATAEPLHLEPTKNADEMITLLERLADEKHSDPPPKPKTRKRTVAERAADEAAAAEQEKFMLTLDERLSSTAGSAQGGADGGEGAVQSGATTFEPRFERFKVIADIKREHTEKKEQEKIRQAEQERKLNLQRQQQQAEQAQLLANRQQEAAEKHRKEEAARQAQLRQHQEAQRRAMAAQQAQTQAAVQAQVQVSAAQSPPNMQHQMSQASHGHPIPSPMAGANPAHRFPPQVSQAAASSPVVRQGTPQNMSSPMVGAGNVPMQQTNSSIGASPARPSSVVQNHPPMSAPMAVSMSARGSQQSHPAGTPRMPSATPQMAHGTPINRPMPTPRLPQASPPPGMMAQNSQMGQAMLMGSQGMGPHMQNPAAQLMAQQQRQRIAAQQLAAAQLQGGMMNGMNGQNPQIQNMAQLQHLQQQKLMQQQLMNAGNNPQMMNGNQMMNQAQQAQMAQRLQQMAMQQQHQQQQQAQQQQQHHPQAPQQNFMGGMNPAQMAAFQQQVQQHQQQQGMMRGAMGGADQNPLLTRTRYYYNQAIGMLIQKYGSPQQIPPDQHAQFKNQCQQRAMRDITMMRNQAQQQQQQQAMMQQNGMNGGM